MAIIPRKRKDGQTSYGIRVHGQWAGTTRTKAEARRLEAQLITRYSTGHGPTKETVAEHASHWLQDRAVTPAESTMAVYRTSLRALAAALGDVRMTAVTGAQARQFVREHPRHLRVAKLMFTEALRDQIIDRNPFDGLRAPPDPGRRHLIPPTETEARALADAAVILYGPGYGEHFAAAILFSFYVGLRAGELMALEHRDIDTAKARIRIERTAHSRGRTSLPKSRKPRTIVLLPPARQALEQALAHAPAPSTETAARRVFLSKRGRPLGKSRHHELWAPVAAAAGHPGLDWHMLRHACATWLLDDCGLDHDAVAVQLGHANASLVLTRYGHPSQDRARQRIEDAYARSARKARNKRPQRERS